MTCLLALDPGESTGWSLWGFDAETPLTHLEHGIIEGGVRGFVDWWQAQPAIRWSLVVSESFELDGRTTKPNITPLRIEGALAVLWPDTHYQSNVYKSAMRDEKIKSLGLWWPGPGHDVDSLRHAFAFMKGQNHAPTINMLQPIPAYKLKAMAAR